MSNRIFIDATMRLVDIRLEVCRQIEKANRNSAAELYIINTFEFLKTLIHIHLRSRLGAEEVSHS